MEKAMIEFYLSGTHELWMRDAKGERKFLAGEIETVRRVNGIMIAVYPKVYETLAKNYSGLRGNKMNYEYRIAARFVRCNMSEDDMRHCDIDGDKMNLEQTKCPLKGSKDVRLRASFATQDLRASLPRRRRW